MNEYVLAAALIYFTICVGRVVASISIRDHVSTDKDEFDIHSREFLDSELLMDLKDCLVDGLDLIGNKTQAPWFNMRSLAIDTNVVQSLTRKYRSTSKCAYQGYHCTKSTCTFTFSVRIHHLDLETLSLTLIMNIKRLRLDPFQLPVEALIPS